MDNINIKATHRLAAKCNACNCKLNTQPTCMIFLLGYVLKKALYGHFSCLFALLLVAVSEALATLKHILTKVVCYCTNVNVFSMTGNYKLLNKCITLAIRLSGSRKRYLPYPHQFFSPFLKGEVKF